MRAEQAIYTSLRRGGRDGYQLVSRSPGVSEAEAKALACWSPSHGALIVDEANRASLNVHPLAEGRLAVSRTCEGPPEYSGRGGRQVYTHAVVLEAARLERSGTSPIALYVQALALGVFRYRADPDPVLDPVELGRCLRPPGAIGPGSASPPPLPLDLDGLRGRLIAGDRVELRHAGDRLRLAEHLLAPLPAGLVATLSVSTSLKPSSARPFQLRLVG